MTDSAERYAFRVRRHNEPSDPTALVSADRLVVVVSGDVDLATAPSLRQALESAIDVHPDVCCDLREVTFFSAAGISALVYARQRADRAGSRFHIRGARGITRRILRITGLEMVLSALQVGDAESMANPDGEPVGQ
ncbi:STAS domain-containing protein [Micromonospora sp. NPDC049559]|uniref:STAS domain-containing protein n=1 Tax=Micromonospora sp. NPDC049559 TaxID=3155923 RepID=UPI003439B567